MLLEPQLTGPTSTDLMQNQLFIGLAGGLISLLLLAVGWFVIREITKKDKIADNLELFENKMTEDIQKITANFTGEIRAMADRSTVALEALNKAISQLSIAMTEQRVWMAEHYVAKGDYKEDLKVVHERVTRTNLRVEEIENCPRRDCPLKSDPRTRPGGTLG